MPACVCFHVFKHHLFKFVLAVLCVDDLAFAVLNCCLSHHSVCIIVNLYCLLYLFIYFAWGFNLYTSCVLGLHPFCAFCSITLKKSFSIYYYCCCCSFSYWCQVIYILPILGLFYQFVVWKVALYPLEIKSVSIHLS